MLGHAAPLTVFRGWQNVKKRLGRIRNSHLIAPQTMLLALTLALLFAVGETSLVSDPRGMNDEDNSVETAPTASTDTVTIREEQANENSLVLLPGEEAVIEIEVSQFSVERDFHEGTPLAASVYFRINLPACDDDADNTTPPEEDWFRAPQEVSFLQRVYTGGFEIDVGDNQLSKPFVGPIYIPKRLLPLPITMRIEMWEGNFLRAEDKLILAADLTLVNPPYIAKVQNAAAIMEVRVRAVPHTPTLRAQEASGSENFFWHQNEVGAVLVKERYEAQDFDSVRVAVIDTGIDFMVQGLVDKIVFWRDLVNAKSDPYDDNGHGTEVAALIAGKSTGIAGNADLVVIKAISRDGDGAVSDIAYAIRLAAVQEAKIINVSLGWIERSLSSADIQLLESAVDFAHARGAILVSSAGNFKSGLKHYPAYFEDVWSISALRRFEPARSDNTSIDLAAQIAGNESYLVFLDEYSCYGPALDVPHKSVEFSAPGAGIPSISNPGNTTFGTSFAAAVVSASASLVVGYARGTLGEDPSPDDIRHIFIESAKDLGAKGWDPYYGYGLVQVHSALLAADKFFGNRNESANDISPP